mgnify:CR=1 FL=1
MDEVLRVRRLVCVFADNRQCEEWAMMRDRCPVGGIDDLHGICGQARHGLIAAQAGWLERIN